VSGRDLLAFALRALTGHRLRSALSLLGVAIGVAAVVLLTALGEGARRYVTQQFESLGSNVLIVMPGRVETTGGVPGFGGVPNDLTLADLEAIRRGVPSVSRIAPLAVGTETIAFGDRRRQVPVAGTTRDMLDIRHLTVARGDYLPRETGREPAVVVLGQTVANELFPGLDPVGQVVRIGAWRMRVIGVNASRGVQMGTNFDEFVIVPVATAMRMFDRSSLFRVLIEVRSHGELDQAKAAVEALLTARHRELDVTCLTQDAVLTGLNSILGALTLALGGIAAVSLAVAGVGIMNVMLISVSERTREVGLLKALGAGRRQVLSVFLAEAVMLSGAGGVVGLAVGFVAVQVLIGFYPGLPARPPLWAVVAASVLSLLVGAGFGVLPARRAMRLEPVAALSRR
jgi:putative ABC transport system permease protein